MVKSSPSVGIGHAQLREYTRFQGLHANGLRVILMIMSEEVENSVHDQMADMVEHSESLGPRLRRNCLEGQCQIA